MNWRLSVFFIPFVYFLSCATSEGQNWSPFRVDIRMLYGVESELPKFGSLHLMGKLIIPFQVDTLTGSPSTGYTFGYSDSLQLSNSGNWLGAPVFGPGFITSQFGEFSIQGGMNMTFLPKVIEGSVAAVLRIQGNVALRAVVVRKGLDSVLSVTDSVATLKWIPEAGYELLSLANDTTFLLSRSFGLIRFRNLWTFGGPLDLPFDFFFNHNLFPDYYTDIVHLIGIPILGLGSKEMSITDFPKPVVGDELQILKEDHYDFNSSSVPCEHYVGHDFGIYHEKCVSTQTDIDGTVYSTWKWMKATSTNAIVGPVIATDTGTIIRSVSGSSLVINRLSRKIGFHTDPLSSSISFSGQFESNSGLRLKFYTSQEVDALPAVIILPGFGFEEMSSSSGSLDWVMSPCSTGTSQTFATRVRIPTYLKTNGISYGTPILITANQPEIREPSIRIFPNPVCTKLWVSNPENVRSIHITNLLGKEVLAGELDSEGKMSVELLIPGIYQIRLHGQPGEIGMAKFLKQ